MMAGRVDLRNLGIAIATLVCLNSATWAQQYPVFKEALPVATLNSTRLFTQSLAGRAALKKSQTKSRALADENRGIEADLEQEEVRLTELRKTIPAEEFRALAEAFDKRVVETRQVQNAKAADLSRELNTTQRAFSVAVQPILKELMSEKGIVFILSEQAIVLGERSGDITEEALRRVDIKIGTTLEPGK